MTDAPYFFSTISNDTFRERFPHRFYMKGRSQAKHFDAALAWCKEHFGPGALWHNPDPQVRWVWNNLGDIHLADPREALEFRLRWC